MLQIYFDARGKQAGGIGFAFPYSACLGIVMFYFFHSHMRVPDFALELVREAWSEWCLGIVERPGISSSTCLAMSMDGEAQNKSFV
jgi:hypothetical protein